MSREFGSDCRGYLHNQIEMATTDCEDGGLCTTRAFGCLFKALESPTYALCSAEQCDWSERDFLIATIEAIPNIRAQVDHIDATARQRLGEIDTEDLRKADRRAAALAKLTMQERKDLGLL